MKIDNKTVGIKIHEIRLSLGESMEKFGERFKTSKGTVNNWEKGRNLPNKPNLLKIATLGEISVNELLYGDMYEKYLYILKKRIEEESDFFPHIPKEIIEETIRLQESDERDLIHFSNKNNIHINPEDLTEHFIDSLLFDNPKDNYELLKDLLGKIESTTFWLDIVFQKRKSNFHINFGKSQINQDYYEAFYPKLQELQSEIKVFVRKEAENSKENLKDYNSIWGLDN